MIIDVPRIYDKLVKDGKQRLELMSQIEKDSGRSYEQEYGYSNAILTKKCFRYPFDNVSLKDLKTKKTVVSQQNCFESGLENYFLVLAEGYKPDFYNCFFENEGGVPHAIVLYKKNKKLHVRDTVYCGSGSAKIYEKDNKKYLRVGNGKPYQIRDLLKRDIKSVLWDTECYRQYGGLVDILAINQRIKKMDFFEKWLVINLKYEPEDKKLLFSIDLYFQGSLLGRIKSTGLIDKTSKGRIFNDFELFGNKLDFGWGSTMDDRQLLKISCGAVDDIGMRNEFLKNYEELTKKFFGKTECLDEKEYSFDQPNMLEMLYLFELRKSRREFLHSKDKIVSFIKNWKDDSVKIKKIFDKVERIRNERLKWEKNLCAQYNRDIKNKTSLESMKIFGKYSADLFFKSDRRCYLDSSYLMLCNKMRSKKSLSEIYNKAKTKEERERILRSVDMIMTSPLRKGLFEEIGKNPWADVTKNREKRIAAIGFKRGLDKKKMIDNTYLDVINNIDSLLYLPEKAGRILRKIV